MISEIIFFGSRLLSKFQIELYKKLEIIKKKNEPKFAKFYGQYFSGYVLS
ncbi:hypothetical protein ATE84_1985 [Aquimarina sp. MAR_2010_214]|nr:hypothetical protein ATE84_1985 [Aquimarina sp. MAR_2010_214]